MFVLTLCKKTPLVSHLSPISETERKLPEEAIVRLLSVPHRAEGLYLMGRTDGMAERQQQPSHPDVALEVQSSFLYILVTEVYLLQTTDSGLELLPVPVIRAYFKF